MGSWVAREIAVAVAVVAGVVVGAQVLFNVELGAAIGIGVAFLVVLMTVSVVQWRSAADNARGRGGAAPQSARRYTSDHYARLSPGMSVADVDAIMGGGGQSSESETGGLVHQYVNVDGSNVTVTFLDGSLSTKAMSGLEDGG